MQLELFDIRSDHTASKGKAGKMTGPACSAKAVGHTDADSPETDFLSSLRFVAEKGRADSGGNAKELPDRDQAFDGENLSTLGAILDEIIREWPAGRRPAGRVDSGDEQSETPASGRGGTEPGREKVSRLGSVTVPDSGGQQAVRTVPETAGFNIALIKQLGQMRKTGQTQTAAKPVAGAAGITAGLQTAAVNWTGRAEKGTGQDTGISILNHAAVRATKAASTPLNSTTGEIDAHKESIRQAVAELKNGSRTVGRTVVAPTTGENPVPAASEKNSRPDGHAIRSGRAGSSGLLSAARDASAAVKLPGGHDPVRDAQPDRRPAEVTARSPKAAAGSGAVFKPEADGLRPEQNRVAAGNMDAGEPADSRNRVARPAETARPIPVTAASTETAVSLKAARPGRKAAATIKGSADHQTADPRQTAAADGAKSPAAIERKESLGGDANPVDRERFDRDALAGQAVRESKNGEQPRIETGEARIKPMESAATAPKSQPAAPAGASAEAEKPGLDRVAQARVLEQITGKFKLNLKKGTNEIRINLKPETLGQVQLKVLAQDQNVTVKMVAETAVARDVIENNIGQLRADLNALGLNVEKLAVDVFTANDPGERHAAQQQGGQSGNGRGTSDQGARENDPTHRAQQLHAAEDAADGGTLVGVFA